VTSEQVPPGRICVIGAGAFGRFCLDTYARVSDVSVVCVVDPDAAALAKVHAPGAMLETDWRRAVERSDAEVVHILTPPDQRDPIVDAAIAAGKSVFCEKPPALALDSLDRMMAAAQAGNVVFSVDYVMRHLAAFRLLRVLAGSGALGAPRTLAFTNFAQNVPAGHWFWDQARSGGILVEHGVHFFDIYGRLFGRAESVRAIAPRPEVAAAAITYPSGRTGFYLHDFSYPPAVEQTRAELGFDKATVTVDGWIATGVEGCVDRGREPELRDAAGTSGVGIEIAGEGDVVRFRAAFPDRQAQYAAAIVAGMRDVVAAHRSRRGWPISAADIRESLRVALAAQQSATN